MRSFPVSFVPQIGMIFMLSLNVFFWQAHALSAEVPIAGDAPEVTLTRPFDPISGMLSLHTTQPEDGEWSLALVDYGAPDIVPDGIGGWIGTTAWIDRVGVAYPGDTLTFETGGTDGAPYTLFIQQVGATHSGSNVLKIPSYIEDHSAPTITITEFLVLEDKGSIRISTDEEDNRLYLVVSETNDPISKTQLQQGLDGLNLPAIYAQQVELTGIGDIGVDLDGLTVGIPYHVSAYQVDDRGLESDIVTLASTIAIANVTETFDLFSDGTRLIDLSAWSLLHNSSGTPMNHIVSNGEVQVSPLPTGESHLLITQTTAEPATNRFVEGVIGSAPTVSNNALYLVIRGVDPDNYYRALIRPTSIRLEAIVAGVGSNNGFRTIPTITSGDVIRLEYRSGNMTLSINGVDIDTFIPPAIVGPRGTVGFGNYMSSAQGGASLNSFTYGDLL